MTDSQQERILLLFKSKYKTMDDVAEKLGISRATLYNKLKESPLDETFKDKVKTELGIDLDTMSKNKLDSVSNYTILELRDKIEELLRQLVNEQQKRINDKDKIIGLQEQIDALKDKYERNLG